MADPNISTTAPSGMEIEKSMLRARLYRNKVIREALRRLWRNRPRPMFAAIDRISPAE